MPGLAVALAALLAAPAAAAPAAPSPAPVSAVDRCLVVDALTGLTPDERRQLVDACRRHAPPPPPLAALLARVAARADWESAALGDLLAGGAPHQDLGPDPAAAARLKAVRDGLQARLAGCATLHKPLDAYLADRDAGELPSPPFTADSVAACLRRGPDELADLALLTIPADDPAAQVFVAAAAGERVVVQWLGDGDAVVHRGRRIYVAVVPRWSVVSVRAGAAAQLPHLWHGFVTWHRTIWDSPPAAGCLRMSVDLDADTTLLLDGRVLTRGERLAHRTIGVPAGAHTLAAVRCAGDTCVQRFRETLPAATPGDNLCQDVALDLHQRRSVAILQARSAPGCDAALAWRAGQLAADLLQRNEKEIGRTFRDLAAYASMTQALGNLYDGLNPAEGRAVGASTGSDSLELVSSIAKEAWRQGIDELVTLEFRCTGPATGYSLQATKISIKEAFDRQLGAVRGLDLKNLLRIHTVPFNDPTQLPSTVNAVLSHLFTDKYLLFREGPSRFSYRTHPTIELIGSSPIVADAPEVDVHPVERSDDPRAPCGAPLRRWRGLTTTVNKQTALTSADNSETFSARLRVRRPGPHYLFARWSSSVMSIPGRCIDFFVPPRELWGSVIIAPDLTYRTPVTDLSARHFRFTLGHTWYLRGRPWLGLGAALAYTYTRYAARDGLPAWQDLTVDPALTHAALDWGRHALVLGPLLELRSRSAHIPVEFRGRLTAGIGPALVNVAGLAAVPEFATTARFGTSDLRMRWTVDAAAELGVSAFAGPLAITPLVALGATALNDMNSSRWAVSATGGAGLYVGFGLHLGGAP